jgi:hypothetical protein
LDGGSARRKAITYTGQHNIEKRGHTSMPRAAFEPTIQVFGRSKTVRGLDRAANNNNNNNNDDDDDDDDDNNNNNNNNNNTVAPFREV